MSCSACHANGFAGTPRECVACHRDDYDRTTNPNHRPRRFPDHLPELPHEPTWEGRTFDHELTRFPLTGAHTAGRTARGCHANGQFAGTPTAVRGLPPGRLRSHHEPEPPRGGIPDHCENCHTTEQWPGATVDHNLTRFPLTGAHVGVQCTRCHVGGRFAGTPTDCFSCHQDDYDRATPTTAPRASRRPARTATAPTVGGATFNHPFPLSGPHAGHACTSCHPNQGNFRVFQCTTSCHPRGEMDDRHEDDDDARGYVYESSACLRCHPDGRE